MGVIGNSPAPINVRTQAQAFNGDGSTVAFTMNRRVQSTVDIEVLVDNVQQSPYDSSYSVAGNILTFSEAPNTGSNNIYVIFRAGTVRTAEVIPDDGSVTTAKIADGAITAAKLDDNAVTAAAVSSQANTANDFFALPAGTSAQRPLSPSDGYIRYNTEENQTEEYRGGSWRPLSSKFSATGGTITIYTDGDTNYKVHTFTSSGIFEVTNGTSFAEYIIVAGGGGGGGSYQSPGGGGGGAGGFVSGTGTFAIGTFSVVVGAGGTAGVGDGAQVPTFPGNGANSSFDGFTAIGGGSGGVYSRANGGNGGSGGGGSYDRAPGSGTSGQGNSGGTSTGVSPDQNSGGGGGAGSAGANGTASSSGAGGAGVSSSITGSSLFYAGGGGGGGGYNNGPGGLPGGAGGSGVGGDGGTSSSSASAVVGENGQINRGGGGGGAGGPVGAIDQSARAGGAGGSGVVIIRYAI